MVFNLADDEWDDVIRVHLRGTFVVSRPACRHWRAQAKQHGTHLRTADQHRDRAAALRRRGPVELRRGEGGHQRVHRGGRDRDGALRRDGQRDHARREHAARADRLAHVTRDRRRTAATQQALDLRDPVHVAEFGCFLASPEAAGISGQTFQVHGGTIEHVEHVARRADLAPRRPRLHRRRARRRAPARRRPESRRPPTRRVDRRPPSRANQIP